jgi:uncharacterized protein YbjQ (UPF0145 family)
MLDRIKESWLELTVVLAAGVVIGHAVGSKRGVTRGSANERAICVGEKRKEYQRGLVEAKRAASNALDELVFANAK